MFIIVFFSPDLSVCFADNAFIAPYPSHLVVRRCDFFWTEAGETPVNRISLQDDRVVPLVRKMGSPENFVIHGPTESVVGNLPFLDDFVVDENQVFFSEHDTGKIRKISITGGTPATLISP